MRGRTRITGDGPSPLQRLKNLPLEDREFIVEQKNELSAARLIAQIETRHGIHGLSAARLSDFLRWMAEQREIRAANESVQNIREIFAEVMPDASVEETHKFLLQYLTAAGFGKADAAEKEKALRFVVAETRKGAALGLDRDKFEFDAAKAALACLPALKAISADKSLDDRSRLDAARKALFGVTPE